ncbi:hypothetical protein [Botrimarina sp.]|uniref:hypothetical protein n=1 Tax=Botrimarina sp. TaxID=2795802 RepID=UPI0032EE556D
MTRLLGFSALLLAVALGGPALGQNNFGDPSFEGAITYDGPPFVGVWEGFSGSAGASATNDTTNPLSGSQHANLSILGDDNSFAGVFQDVVGLGAGTEITFSGFHAIGGMADVGVEFRIEWRDSVMGTEISRTPNSTTAPTSTDYEPFSLTSTVPAGADSGRFVYAVQTFGGEPGPSNTGTIFLDDLVATPEPTAALLASLGLIPAMLRRRS